MLEEEGKGELEAIIKAEFEQEGIVLSASDIKDLRSHSHFTHAELLEQIRQLDKQRRYQFFIKYPIIDDLLEDPDLIDSVEKIAANKDSDFTKKMLARHKNLTHDQLLDGIAFALKKDKIFVLP